MAKEGALAAPVTVSDELAAIVGAKQLPRTEITKKMWEHIKATEGAQEGRIIHPEVDPKLSAVLGTEPVDMLKMTSIINAKHILK